MAFGEEKTSKKNWYRMEKKEENIRFNLRFADRVSWYDSG